MNDEFDKLNKLEKDELIKKILQLKKSTKYGIVWDSTDVHGTKEKFENESIGKLPILKEVKNKEVKDKKNSINHILIEGDNYHALSVLNYTHPESIDVIYIDPPYNRGGDFKYNDHYVEEDDGYRHSKWISFISKRLKLAKKLLKKDGLIFISIDENELAQLKLLCDRYIFRENNFLACVTWRQLHTVKNNAVHFSKSTEYILVYANNKEYIKKLRQPLDKSANYKIDDNDGKGPYKLDPLSARNKNIEYEFFFEKWKVLWKAPVGSYPRYSIKTLKEMYDADEIVYKKGWDSPAAKRYLWRVQEGVPPSTFWDGKDVGFNANATRELAEILTRDAFKSPKPSTLIKRCLEIGFYGKKDGIVLDFTAGSGTTGHAVLALNKEDGGKRKFILCTNNENNICDEVTHPRLSNVMKGYPFKGEQKDILFEKKLTYSAMKKNKEIFSEEIVDEIEQLKITNKNNYQDFKVSIEKETIQLIGIKEIKDKKLGLGGNLKYFRTGFVDGEITDINKKKLVDESTEMLCLKEDCFDEIKSEKFFKIFKNDFGDFLGIIYDDDGIEPFKKEILKLKNQINTYVFSLDDSTHEEEFKNVLEMVNLKPIPAAILNVYWRIFR